jgi:hypothetical protein
LKFVFTNTVRFIGVDMGVCMGGRGVNACEEGNVNTFLNREPEEDVAQN